jgi:hypothetical protein
VQFNSEGAVGLSPQIQINMALESNEYRTVIEGDKEPVPSEERERLAALRSAKHQNEVVTHQDAPSSEVVRSASLESDPGSHSGSFNRSASSLSRSSSGRSKRELLDLKRQAVGALPRGASQDEEQMGDIIERANLGGEVHESIVGDEDPVPEQERERREAVESVGGEEKKGVGRRFKEKIAGLFGGAEKQEKGTTDAPAGADEKSGEGSHFGFALQVPSCKEELLFEGYVGYLKWRVMRIRKEVFAFGNELCLVQQIERRTSLCSKLVPTVPDSNLLPGMRAAFWRLQYFHLHLCKMCLNERLMWLTSKVNGFCGFLLLSQVARPLSFSLCAATGSLRRARAAKGAIPSQSFHTRHVLCKA